MRFRLEPRPDGHVEQDEIYTIYAPIDPQEFSIVRKGNQRA